MPLPGLRSANLYAQAPEVAAITWTFVGAASQNDALVTVPASTAAGDLIIMCSITLYGEDMEYDPNDGTLPNIPTIGQDIANWADGSSYTAINVYHKIAESGDGSKTWGDSTTPTAAYFAVAVFRPSSAISTVTANTDTGTLMWSQSSTAGNPAEVTPDYNSGAAGIMIGISFYNNTATGLTMTPTAETSFAEFTDAGYPSCQLRCASIDAGYGGTPAVDTGDGGTSNYSAGVVIEVE